MDWYGPDSGAHIGWHQIGQNWWSRVVVAILGTRHTRCVPKDSRDTTDQLHPCILQCQILEQQKPGMLLAALHHCRLTSWSLCQDEHCYTPEVHPVDAIIILDDFWATLHEPVVSNASFVYSLLKFPLFKALCQFWCWASRASSTNHCMERTFEPSEQELIKTTLFTRALRPVSDFRVLEQLLREGNVDVLDISRVC